MNTITETSVDTKEKDLIRRGAILSESFIGELLGRIDIVDIIGKYVKLKKKGKDYYGLCPFHSEKSPSFSVTPTKQFYHCFGCGSHGNAIQFLMQYSGMDRFSAVNILAKKANMSIKYGNIYREDYFGRLDRLEDGSFLHEERIQEYENRGYQQSRDPYHRAELEREREYLQSCMSEIARYERSISVILEASDKKHSRFQGKTLTEVLGYEVPDEFSEGNMELQELSLDVQDGQEDIVTQFLEEENRAEMAEKQRLLNEENTKIEAERLAEEQRFQEISRAKQENPQSLYTELLVSAKEQEDFFASCKYNVILEGDAPLGVGDFGKLVLVFESQSSMFSVVLGKQKSESPIPKSWEEAFSKTFSSNAPHDIGRHSSIAIPAGTERFGGAQYIVLPDNTILIGGESGDYGSVPKELLKKCLLSSGYTVYFLDNTSYVAEGNVHRRIKKKK